MIVIGSRLSATSAALRIRARSMVATSSVKTAFEIAFAGKVFVRLRNWVGKPSLPANAGDGAINNARRDPPRRGH